MFDKRLMEMCPESRKYILGNILLQFLELCANAVMIITIAFSIQRIYNDHRKAKSIDGTIDFAAKRQVWQRTIL